MILLGPGAYIADYDINAWANSTLVIFLWAIPGIIAGSGPRLSWGLEKADLQIRSSFAFIEVTIFASGSLSGNVFLS